MAIGSLPQHDRRKDGRPCAEGRQREEGNVKLFRTWRDRRLRASVAIAAALCAGGCALHQAPDTPRVRFERSVQEYLELRQQAVKRVGALEVVTDPVRLNANSEQLLQVLQAARQGLRQGIFFPFSFSATLRQALA